MLTQTVPGVSGAVQTINEFRVHRQELHKRAQDRAVRERMWRQCVENPCLYVDDCRELFPQSFMVPNCAGKTRPASGAVAPASASNTRGATSRGADASPLARSGGTGGVEAAANSNTGGGSLGPRPGSTGSVNAAANSDWKALTRAWEGTCHATVVDRHIGCGHSCTANKDCHTFTLPLSPADIDALFDADWAEAKRRASEHLSVATGPVVSACFRYGCADFETVAELREHLLKHSDERNKATAARTRLTRRHQPPCIFGGFK